MSPPNLKGLLAASSAVQSAVDEAGLGAVTEESSAITLYDRMIHHPEVRAVTRDLYRDGYYSMSVEQCFKFINKSVKDRSRSDKDGKGLMFAALASDSPLLRLNAMQTQSEKDEQEGYAQIFAGCMLGCGIRGRTNPTGRTTR